MSSLRFLGKHLPSSKKHHTDPDDLSCANVPYIFSRGTKFSFGPCVPVISGAPHTCIQSRPADILAQLHRRKAITVDPVARKSPSSISQEKSSTKKQAFASADVERPIWG